MKKASFKFLTAAGLIVGLLAFTAVKEGGITGKVTPADGAKEVVALATNGTDTLRADLQNGAFTFKNVQKGTYTVWVKAIPPYKNAAVSNVVVSDTTNTDVGEVKLEQ